MHQPPLVFLGYRLKACGRFDLSIPHVREIGSVSDCIRGEPAGASLRWQGLNAATCYDTVTDAMTVLTPASDAAFEVFAFSVLPILYSKGSGGRSLDFTRVFGCDAGELPRGPDPGFVAIGHDVVSMRLYTPATPETAQTLAGLDCSPLSCNLMAREYHVNEYCLLDDLSEAMGAATRFAQEEPEPGPFVVMQVWRHPGVGSGRGSG